LNVRRLDKLVKPFLSCNQGVLATKAQELAKIDALERTYYEAWERSIEHKETKTAEKTNGGDAERIKAISRQEQRYVDRRMGLGL
jgi:hypothetical protein